ncbi:MAG TPA: YceI family protein [Xylella sp.]
MYAILRIFILFSVLPVSFAAAQQRLKLDPVNSYFEFEVGAYLGPSIQGAFPRFDGEVVSVSEDRQKVRLRFYTADAVIPGRPHYTHWIRGESFFDAQHFPTIEFESQPYSNRVIVQGGRITGTLTMRGISHEETLQIQPATCARPGYDCDVVSTGSISRGRYGMESWWLVVGNQVTFRWHGRVIDGLPSP